MKFDDSVIALSDFLLKEFGMQTIESGSLKKRYLKTDNNLLFLKCEMDAGHSGKSGRTSAIEEVAFDYAFALKISGKLNTPLEN